MSIKAITWVWENSGAQGTELLCMLALADYANDEGEAYPGIQRLAHRCRVGERAIQKVISKLVDLGEIEVIHNQGIATSTGKTNLYKLTKYVKGVNVGTPLKTARGEREDTLGVNVGTPLGVNVGTPDPSVITISDPSDKKALAATQPPAAAPSLSKRFSELLDELKTTKNRPACLRQISILCFGENADTPTYAYLAKAAKQVGGAGRLAEEMWKLTAKPPTGDVLAYILGKCKSQKNGNGFGLTNWRKNNGEDSAVEDTSGDSGEQADFWRNHFANNPVVPTLPAVQGRGLGVRS